MSRQANSILDVVTGEIALRVGWRVGGGCAEADFAAAVADHADHTRRTVQGYVRHHLRGLCLGDRTFNATFLFAAEGLLERVSLSLASGASGWDSWSLEDEQKRKVGHDAWLAGQLGPPPYDYPWGSVSSCFHPQSGASVITVSFRPAGAGDTHDTRPGAVW